MSVQKQKYFRHPSYQGRLTARALYRLLLRELPPQEALTDRRLKRQQVREALKSVCRLYA